MVADKVMGTIEILKKNLNGLSLYLKKKYNKIKSEKTPRVLDSP
jgi:hypothetical protein